MTTYTKYTRPRFRIKLSLNHFRFEFSGHGHYKVVYTNPINFKQFSTVTNDMQLIDATKNSDQPKFSNLIRLKKLCINN